MLGKSRDELGLLYVLIDGFEKNEVLDGWHWRDLPMPDEDSARRKYSALIAEATRWKGPPVRVVTEAGRGLSAWSDLEVRQAGRGVMVRVCAPWFDNWWHDEKTWAGDPMGALHAWADEQTEDIP
jgi:hypothetical protein